jgi:hypothetical protein
MYFMVQAGALLLRAGMVAPSHREGEAISNSGLPESVLTLLPAASLSMEEQLQAISLLQFEDRLVVLDYVTRFIAGVLSSPLSATALLGRTEESSYRSHAGCLPTSAGELPVLALQPQQGNAGLADLVERGGLPLIDLRWVPEEDARWRLTMRRHPRAVHSVARYDSTGRQEVVLGRWAGNPVHHQLRWYRLVEQLGRVLVCGPVVGLRHERPRGPIDVAPDVCLTTTAAAGQLAGVLADVTVD